VRHGRMTTLVLTAALVMAMTASPAMARSGPTYTIDHDQVASLVAAIDAPGVMTVHGEIAGAAYVGQMPDDWNGDLVVWAHGYRGEGTSLTVDPPPVREWLLDGGTAWIASSYRRNSYDPGIGMFDTKGVANEAATLFGEPDHTYVAGVSMGGHVIAATLERFPSLFDGALPACGVLGDVELFDYFTDYSTGAAAFAGVDIDLPDENFTADEVPQIQAALSLHDEAGFPASTWAFDGSPLVGAATDLLFGPGEDFKDFIEVGSGGERGVIYDVGWDYWHAAGGGNFFFDLGEGDLTIANRPGIVGQNVDTDYATEYGFDIDDDVARVTARAKWRRPGGNNAAPVIQGTPHVPVLTMHTTGDLFVPIEMEQIYAREVAANGRSDLLVQRAVRDVGHCTFSDTEWKTSFTDLFAWVEDGVRPAGEDLLGDISSSTLGCDWTVSDGTATARGGVRIFGC
jgi:pimeloyl-ACP methyl ester carboxylesterase